MTDEEREILTALTQLADRAATANSLALASVICGVCVSLQLESIEAMADHVHPFVKWLAQRTSAEIQAIRAYMD